MPDTSAVPDEGYRLAQLTWLIALPATISAALLAATAGYLASGDHTVLLALLAAATVVVLSTAVYAIGKVRRGGDRSAELRAIAVDSRSGLAESRSELNQSRAELVETRGQLGETRNELAAARGEIERLAERLRQAEVAPPHGAAAGRQVEVFVNLSRRLQSLVHREIKLLDALENEVEDPDLLKGLFQVDHLATRIRRHAENLAVLGGSVSRRQWSRPVALTEVLRSAIAEVEHYSRVKLVPPIDGTLPGHAVASVVHLIAELIENATMFAPPQTQVLLRAQQVAAGVAIEVEDRGLGMQRGDQERINQLLVNPDHFNLDDLLRDGRIGLYVVSVIARQHGIVVQLQTNIYGGTQAIVILPQPLLDSPSTGEHLKPVSRPESLSELTTEIPQQPARPVSPPPLSPAPPIHTPLHQAAQQQVAQQQVAQQQVAQQQVAQHTAVPQQAIPHAAAQHTVAQQQVVPQQVVPQQVAQQQIAPQTAASQQVPLQHNGVHHRPAAPAPSPVAQPVPLNGDRYGPGSLAAGPSAGFSAGAPAASERSSALPPLPRRRSQTHMVPQLQLGPPAPAPEPAGEHDPSLMASFMHGVSQGEADPADADRLQ